MSRIGQIISRLTQRLPVAPSPAAPPRATGKTAFRAEAAVTDLDALGGDRLATHYEWLPQRSGDTWVMLRHLESNQRLLVVLASALGDAPSIAALTALHADEAAHHEVTWRAATGNVLSEIRRVVPRELGDQGSVDNERTAAAWREFEGIVRAAHASGASDIHFETTNDSTVVLLRIDGYLSVMRGTWTPREMHTILASAYQHAVPGTTSDSSLPLGQEIASARTASCQISVNVEHADRTVSPVRLRFECSTADPAPLGSDTVIRIAAQAALDPRTMGPSLAGELEQLGYLPEQAKWMERGCLQGEGGVLVVGPTGQGKTRTAYTCMAFIAVDVEKSISLEDPKEADLFKVRQISVTPPEGVSEDEAFEMHFRSAMRRDPDHLLIGEIRSRATANAFVQACITGHLALSTTHANNVINGIYRLSFDPIAIPIENLAAPDVFNVLAHQMLLPRLCRHCKQPAKFALDQDELALIDRLGDVDRVYVRNLDGCEHCRGRTRGIDGRTACAEVLVPDDELLELLRAGDFAGAGLLQRSRWLTGDLRDGLLSPDMNGKTAMEAALYKCLALGEIDVRAIQSTMKDFGIYLRRLGVRT
ncbi:GspE/PulE family protein [Chitinimonas koreensis]|uniref:GspE/PulE family protein n=1 Tax=Chitinimonas koreensis TaxID=356302 RepID=UPI0003FFF653|nr:ATPase, T2SS/T4P/T4SS family [Chitinimonas koreensis]QNM95517.1 Flp pilus assembly complex ATPase component TadA [Chitinimonas koreensis]